MTAISLHYIHSQSDTWVLSQRPHNTHGGAHTHTRTLLSFPRRTWFAAKANSVQAQVALDDMVWSNKWDTEISRGSVLSFPSSSYSIPAFSVCPKPTTLHLVWKGGRKEEGLLPVNWFAVTKHNFFLAAVVYCDDSLGRGSRSELEKGQFNFSMQLNRNEHKWLQ